MHHNFGPLFIAPIQGGKSFHHFPKLLSDGPDLFRGDSQHPKHGVCSCSIVCFSLTSFFFVSLHSEPDRNSLKGQMFTTHIPGHTKYFTIT